MHSSRLYVLPENHTTCLSHNSTYRAFCEMAFPAPEAAETRRTSLEYVLRTCHWNSTRSHTVLPRAHWSSTSVPTGMNHTDLLSIDHSEYRVETCRAPAEDGDSFWLVTRAGPFNTTGGTDWTSLQFPIDPGGTHVPTGSVAEVVGYYLGSTTREGAILGYPPIHQHHFHVVDRYSAGIGTFQIVAHGDDQCTRDQVRRHAFPKPSPSRVKLLHVHCYMCVRREGLPAQCGIFPVDIPGACAGLHMSTICSTMCVSMAARHFRGLAPLHCW